MHFTPVAPSSIRPEEVGHPLAGVPQRLLKNRSTGLVTRLEQFRSDGQFLAALLQMPDAVGVDMGKLTCHATATSCRQCRGEALLGDRIEYALIDAMIGPPGFENIVDHMASTSAAPPTIAATGGNRKNAISQTGRLF